MTVSAWKIPLPISAVQSDTRDGFIKVQGSRKAGGENEMLSLSHLQQIPSSETQSSSASQAIPFILLHPTVHGRVHNSPTLILSQNSQAHVLLHHFSWIRFNIILVSMPGFSEWFLPFTFPMTTILPYASPVYVPSYFLVPDLPNCTEWAVQIVNLLMTHLSPPLSYLLPVALTTFTPT